ncbi:MAG: tRNA (5-methylaminomethyl-2-thiouridylate)-methyltransferase [Gammaproteobacteria bacterium]|nr:MAG: tRNA (5-methylaminomethyl-2-thiouridylate)-methyltransferase [Gammaproteobacteria bacterium]
MLPTADGSLTLESARYGETYHSRHGAVQEARHVFIEASDLRARLAARLESPSERPLELLEIGFGMGLNCLLALDTAVAFTAGERSQPVIDYTGIEHAMLPVETLRAAGYAQHLRHPELATALHDALDALAKKPVTREQDDTRILPLHLPHLAARLHLGNALSFPPLAATRPQPGYDIIFLDAFSPANNPECWSEGFLARLAAVLQPGGVLCTYSARGSVRRALENAELTVEKLPGPPGKREMLRAMSASTAQSD